MQIARLPVHSHRIKEISMYYFQEIHMFKKKTLAFLVSGALMTMAGTMQATAASTGFDNFTALPSNVAAGSLP